MSGAGVITGILPSSLLAADRQHRRSYPEAPSKRFCGCILAIIFPSVRIEWFLARLQ
jgi:hypothetical protein